MNTVAAAWSWLQLLIGKNIVAVGGDVVSIGPKYIEFAETLLLLTETILLSDETFLRTPNSDDFQHLYMFPITVPHNTYRKIYNI